MRCFQTTLLHIDMLLFSNIHKFIFLTEKHFYLPCSLCLVFVCVFVCVLQCRYTCVQECERIFNIRKQNTTFAFTFMREVFSMLHHTASSTIVNMAQISVSVYVCQCPISIWGSVLTNPSMTGCGWHERGVRTFAALGNKPERQVRPQPGLLNLHDHVLHYVMYA